MAYTGNGDSSRRTYLGASGALTTTSQFMAGYISADNTIAVANTTAAKCVGIIESYQSSGSSVLTVITHGLAKGYANVSITAGSPVYAVDGGKLAAYTVATATTFGALTDYRILGRAEEAASTNGALTIFVNPVEV